MKVYTKIVLQMTDTIGEYIPVEERSYEYEGPVARCCDLFGGPSKQEEQLGSQETSLSGTMMSQFQQQYAQQQTALKNLQTTIGKLATGQTGMGFGAQENALYRGQITAGGGAAARNAQQAWQNQNAGQVFSGAQATSGLRSGIAKQVGAQINTGAAESTQQQLNAETLANIQQGRSNAAQTASMESGLAQLYNPLAYASGASSTEQAAFGQEHQINVEQQQKAQAIAALAEKGISMGAGAIAGGIAGGGGFMDTLKGAAGGALGDSGMFFPSGTGGGGGGASGNFYGTANYGPTSIGGPGMQDVSAGPPQL